MPDSDETMMMFPLPCFCIWMRACLEQRKGPFRLTSMTRSHSSSVVSGSLFSTWMPGLHMRMSSRPNSATATSTIRFAATSLVTSAGAKTALPPSLRMAAATCSPRSSRMSVTTTLAPWRPNSSAVALPRPLAPPVMMATLFSSLFVILSLYRLQQRVGYPEVWSSKRLLSGGRSGREKQAKCAIRTTARKQGWVYSGACQVTEKTGSQP